MVSDADRRKRIGKLIRRHRQIEGWTQAELGTKVGVSESTVANWERGRHFPVRYEGKVEHVLNISLDDDDGTQGLPSIVADNSDLYQVTGIWNQPGFTRSERIHLIRNWLRLRHPERLPESGESGEETA